MKNFQLLNMQTASGYPILYGVNLILCQSYDDYLNNYVSYKTYAEHNGMTDNQALKFLDVAKEAYYSDNVDY